jgi:hypothetical protein
MSCDKSLGVSPQPISVKINADVVVVGAGKASLTAAVLAAELVESDRYQPFSRFLPDIIGHLPHNYH